MDEVVFGRYRLVSVIGQGGMGTVYRAHDTIIDRHVAVKVLPAELATQPGYEQRFRREAHTAAKLTEPHIIPIHDTGEIDGQLYLVMPIIKGVDVHELLDREGPMNPQRAVHIIEQLAGALDAAHAAGLVHRDIKPSNALVTERDFVYLIDFGIAHDAAATKLTNTGMIVGTMAYMAPERFTAGVADARSDVYALTCMLHECLTGERPYPGDSMEQQIAGHLTMDPPRPSQLRPEIPAGFDDVIAGGMAKNPDQRYQSAHDLATAARHALTGTPAPFVTARTTPRQRPGATVAATALRPTTPQPRGQSRAGLIVAAVAAVAVILVAAVVSFKLLQPHSSTSQTSTAQPTPQSAQASQSVPTSAQTSQLASPAAGGAELAPFVGTWTAHKERVVIQAGGTAHMSYQGNSFDFTLTSVSNGVASGSISATSDSFYQVGESVTVKITAGTPNGQLLTMTVGGTQQMPLCDSTAEAGGQCGA